MTESCTINALLLIGLAH